VAYLSRSLVARSDARPARRIWPRACAFLGLPGVEVVEIVDNNHAYPYLWTVGNAVFGAETTAAAAWVEPLKDHSYE
jgi:hypothetical protein